MATKKTAFKDRGAITLEGLKEEFGDAEGARLYGEAARAGGYGDPAEDRGFAHDLDVKGLREAAAGGSTVAAEALARVEAVFAEPAPAEEKAKK